MTSSLKQFKARALARPKVKKAYDDLAEEFAFLDKVLKARVTKYRAHRARQPGAVEK